MKVLERSKKETQSEGDSKLDNALLELKSSITALAAKQQNILADWLVTWAQYLKFERTFKPDRLRYYKRGDVVHIHFGFNVGNEQGGTHYAVVVDNNNNKQSGCIIVIPISSLKHGKTAESLHKTEVYLGKIIKGSDVESYAQPFQIRCVSKLRIIKPKADNDIVHRLTAEQMDRIDKKIIELFTKNRT